MREIARRSTDSTNLISSLRPPSTPRRTEIWMGSFTLSAKRRVLAGSATRRRHIAFLRGVHRHAVCIEAPAKGANRPLHPLDPPSRQSVAIAMIVERNQFVAQNAVEIFSIPAVVHIHVRVCPAGPDRKAIQPVVSLGPPTVNHG